jgi:hypothetical protein
MGNSTFNYDLIIILIYENKELLRLLLTFFRPYTNIFDISICESGSQHQSLILQLMPFC